MTQIVNFGFYTGVAAISTVATLAVLANPLGGAIGITMFLAGVVSATRRN